MKKIYIIVMFIVILSVLLVSFNKTIIKWIKGKKSKNKKEFILDKQNIDKNTVIYANEDLIIYKYISPLTPAKFIKKDDIVGKLKDDTGSTFREIISNYDSSIPYYLINATKLYYKK